MVATYQTFFQKNNFAQYFLDENSAAVRNDCLNQEFLRS